MLERKTTQADIFQFSKLVIFFRVSPEQYLNYTKQYTILHLMGARE